MKNVYISALNVSVFLPYVYGLLRVAAEEDPLVASSYEFHEPFFLPESPAKVVDQMKDPAVLGLSCYIWNYRQHMKVARLCKERYPDTLVVVGGPQIPERVGNFFIEHPYIDLIVHGEGELPFQKILRENLSSQPDWSSIHGISFMRDNQVVTIPKERLPLQDITRSPYLEGYLDYCIDLCKSRNITFHAPWETNRGCPYSCSFCDWGSNTMTKLRRFNDERLMREIEFFGYKQVANVHINDANFGILERDVDIAMRLAEMRQKTGYPRSILANFAKRSNDRVFAISQAWTNNGMLLQGTTLSMQATNPEVLEAIGRSNIGIDRYKDLQTRYQSTRIHTYTEIIMGLPRETRESFKSGLDTVFEMGNHDDVRIYEFAILPNAPVNDPKTRERYGLKTIDKYQYSGPDIPEDERELTPIVIETNTMSRADWVDCSIYSRLVQFLHVGCYTRYLSIHLRKQYNLPYHVFYSRLQQYFQERPDTVLGVILATLQDFYVRYQQQPETPALDVSKSSPAALSMLSMWHRKVLAPNDWAWICLTAQPKTFYRQLQAFLDTLDISFGEEMADVLRFQQDIMLYLNYDPTTGKICDYAYDFPSYFREDAPLQQRPTRIHYQDTHMGSASQFPLERGNVPKFLDAAVGAEWSAPTNRYQHQLAMAKIFYMSEESVAG